MKRYLWRSVIGGSKALKRLLDIVAAACGLIALSPVFLFTALMIKLEDRGPLFFKQTRIGLRGRPFGMWKFRSMVVNADALKDKLLGQNQMQGGVLFKMKDDPRVTRVGAVIRKVRIDELPQLFNFLNGDMSFVGPRPALFNQADLIQLRTAQGVHALMPGLTGWAQVNGRDEIPIPQKVALDREYLERQSFVFDLRILLLTAFKVLNRANVTH